MRKNLRPLIDGAWWRGSCTPVHNFDVYAHSNACSGGRQHQSRRLCRWPSSARSCVRAPNGSSHGRSVVATAPANWASGHLWRGVTRPGLATTRLICICADDEVSSPASNSLCCARSRCPGTDREHAPGIGPRKWGRFHISVMPRGIGTSDHVQGVPSVLTRNTTLSPPDKHSLDRPTTTAALLTPPIFAPSWA